MDGMLASNSSSTLALAESQSQQSKNATEQATKPKKKICCACPETKKLRDECIVEHGEAALDKLYQCLWYETSIMRDASTSNTVISYVSLNAFVVIFCVLLLLVVVVVSTVTNKTMLSRGVGGLGMEQAV
ncbi:Cytochrome c oxidase copper chaperone [Dillenia turbinata]|uniref:Cytochrome c oxidase copper chaperone n=1 Tax=Dillenia turbinata TaxID=194707 RepID=A0AAN8W5U7_9MAGN